MAAVDKNSVKLLSLQQKPQSVPPWVDAARHNLEQSTLVSPLTSKEPQQRKPCWCGKPRQDKRFNCKKHAGHTCQDCPRPTKPNKYLERIYKKFNKYLRSRWAYFYTERCTPCNTRKRNWSRAKELARDIEFCALANGKQIRFVTLTLPNYQDIREGLADLKKKVRNFRYTDSYKKHVIGSCDFYEWTEASDGTYNVHIHTIWIGDYWHQADLLNEWKHGGARIELVKRKMKDSVIEYQEPIQRVQGYIMNYLKKMDKAGIRCQQRTGVLYG